MIYPNLNKIFSKDELIEKFTVSAHEKHIISRINKEVNKLGFAILLKTYQHLGYPPSSKKEIPSSLVVYIASQIGSSEKLFDGYIWRGRVRKYHISIIRKYLGFSPYEKLDYEKIISLIKNATLLDYSKKYLATEAILVFRKNFIDLPSEKELYRIVNSARKQAFDALFNSIYEKLDDEIKEQMDHCLLPDSEDEGYNWLKKPPGKFSTKTILNEINKLKYLCNLKVNESLFKPASEKTMTFLRNRVQGEDAYLMRRHPPYIRYALLLIFIHMRKMEITDHAVTILKELAHRIDKKSELTIKKRIIREIQKVYGKKTLLYKIAIAATKNPDGSIREVLFPEVNEETMKGIIKEYEADEGEYNVVKMRVMKQKYTHHYRKMMKPVLDTLEFCANNPAYKPLLYGLKLVHKYIDSKITYYPESEDIPKGLLTPKWEEVVLQKDEKGTRVLRQYFELFVLQKLEKGLKSKEIWVEGAYKYRNPDKDLPSDWDDRRIEYYRKVKAPLNAEEFIKGLKREMTESLEMANHFFSNQNDVYIYFPGGSDKGLFRVPKIIKRPERPILQEIKGEVIKRWGVLDLLDVLLEADRQVIFLDYFYTSAQRRVLSEIDFRERLLLGIFSFATNMGLKQIFTGAKPDCTYRELRYFRRRFISPDALRAVITALVNRILEIRNPFIWGDTTACASDKKVFGAWDQNLLADWNPHYKKCGVHVYWHVDTNSTCIYSQVKSIWASEVASMIMGLIHHDTEMRIETNFVDSHGQSEVAFAFCRLFRH